MDNQYIPHGHNIRKDHLFLCWLILQNKEDLLTCGVKDLKGQKQQYTFQLSTSFSTFQRSS